jgi:ADP-ribosyl-[dinitrogen reductase] hydrolase
MTQAPLAPHAQHDLQDKFRGVLLGLATGDAFGAPLEFQPARDPNHYVTEMIGGGWLRLEPGAWTDDTQMTLCSVDSLLARRVFDPDDMARRFVAWLHSNPPDVGNHTRAVLTAIGRGVPWEEASVKAQATNPNNAPNGSLMRCAPLALFFYRHPDYVATLSPVLSRITHAHADCEHACVLLNVAIALMMMGADKQAAITGAERACAGASEAFRARIRRAQEPKSETSPSGYVLDTLEVAVWAFLHTPTLEASLIEVVNRGDDADTVGAVTGALAGAYYGLAGIPERWLNALHERDSLLDRSDRLLEIAQSAS